MVFAGVKPFTLQLRCDCERLRSRQSVSVKRQVVPVKVKCFLLELASDCEANAKRFAKRQVMFVEARRFQLELARGCEADENLRSGRWYV